MLSVFLAHAAEDAPFAEEVGAFLEAGCDVRCAVPEGAIKPGEDLISRASIGLASDVLVLLLSPASEFPTRPRERWERVLRQEAKETNTVVAVFLVEECSFPLMLRRGSKFFDAEKDRLQAKRRLKRWVYGIQSHTSPGMAISADLEPLYRELVDQTGRDTVPWPVAERFVDEAGRDFEAVLRVPAHGRSIARIAGELGWQLRMRLEGTLGENCRQIREVLAERRCLLMLDESRTDLDRVLPSGRTSVLFTTDSPEAMEDISDVGGARSLLQAGRLAEAYEILYRLMDDGIEEEACARELVWICERWNRLEEANRLRFRMRSAEPEQLRLF